jgi:hypothetical protein
MTSNISKVSGSDSKNYEGTVNLWIYRRAALAPSACRTSELHDRLAVGPPATTFSKQDQCFIM